MYTCIHVEDVYEIIRNNELVDISFICKELNCSKMAVTGFLTQLWNKDMIEREYINGKAHWRVV